MAEGAGDEDEAARRYRKALERTRALAGSGRLAPSDAWFVGDLEQRLAALGS